MRLFRGKFRIPVPWRSRGGCQVWGGCRGRGPSFLFTSDTAGAPPVWLRIVRAP